jgi:hypothetical protein
LVLASAAGNEAIVSAACAARVTPAAPCPTTVSTARAYNSTKGQPCGRVLKFATIETCLQYFGSASADFLRDMSMLRITSQNAEHRDRVASLSKLGSPVCWQIHSHCEMHERYTQCDSQSDSTKTCPVRPRR